MYGRTYLRHANTESIYALPGDVWAYNEFHFDRNQSTAFFIRLPNGLASRMKFHS